MSCRRRARVPVPCAELALRSARTDGLGDRFTVQPFTPTATGGSSCNDAQRRPRRQAPRNGASILDSARELGIRDAQESQGQGGLDGEIRVAPLPTPPAAPAGCPGSDRFRGQPHRHIAAANEGPVVGRPIRNAVLRLIRGMNLRLHPRSVAPAEGHEKCGPRRPTRSGYSCNNAPQGQGGLDGEIRVPPLPAPPAAPAGCPGSDRLRGDVLQLSKSGKRAIGRVGRAPSHAATPNKLLMN